MIITFSNFKGGVGKTTTTALFSYVLSELKDKKVLAVDTDQQANLTKKLSRTFNVTLDKDKNIFQALLNDDDTSNYIQKLTENLDILSSSWDMSNFGSLAGKYQQKYQTQIIKTALNEVENDYDYILIDTSPATDLIKDNTIIASDFVLITAKTTRDVFDSTQNFYNYLLKYYNSDSSNFELLGVLPYLIGDNKTSKELLAEYHEVFEEDLFKNYIRKSDRVETWENTGIRNDDYNDHRTMTMYLKVVEEAETRIKEFNK